MHSLVSRMPTATQAAPGGYRGRAAVFTGHAAAVRWTLHAEHEDGTGMRNSPARAASFRVLLGVLVLVLLTACGTGPQAAAPSPSPSAANPALDVSVEYPRYLHSRRRLEVIVVNQQAAPITVTQVELRAPQFTPTPPVTKDALIAPGRRVDLQVALGAVDCEVQADAPARAVLRVRDEDGTIVTGRFGLPTEALGRIHDTECAHARVTKAVGLTFADSWQRTPSGIQADLQISRRSSREPISIIDVAGSVIFTMQPFGVEGEPLVTLDRSMSGATLPLELIASRCDPHAVIESKKTYQFNLWVQLGAADEQAVTVTPQPELRAALERLIDECMAADDG